MKDLETVVKMERGAGNGVIEARTGAGDGWDRDGWHDVPILSFSVLVQSSGVVSQTNNI